MREGLRHAIGAPDSIRELSEFCFHRLVDGSATNDEVLYLHQALTLLRYLEGVVDLERDEGSEARKEEGGRRKDIRGRRKDIRGRRKDIRGRRKEEGGRRKEEGGRRVVGRGGRKDIRRRKEEGGRKGERGEGMAGGGDGEEGQVTLEGAHDHHFASDIVE